MEACINENGYELTPFSDETVAGTSVCPTCSNTPSFVVVQISRDMLIHKL